MLKPMHDIKPSEAVGSRWPMSFSYLTEKWRLQLAFRLYFVLFKHKHQGVCEIVLALAVPAHSMVLRDENLGRGRSNSRIRAVLCVGVHFFLTSIEEDFHISFAFCFVPFFLNTSHLISLLKILRRDIIFIQNVRYQAYFWGFRCSYACVGSGRPL